jgi:hypothetical protein
VNPLGPAEIVDRLLGALDLGTAQPELGFHSAFGVALADPALFRLQTPWSGSAGWHSPARAATPVSH